MICEEYRLWLLRPWQLIVETPFILWTRRQFISRPEFISSFFLTAVIFYVCMIKCQYLTHTLTCPFKILPKTCFCCTLNICYRLQQNPVLQWPPLSAFINVSNIYILLFFVLQGIAFDCDIVGLCQLFAMITLEYLSTDRQPNTILKLMTTGR